MEIDNYQYENLLIKQIKENNDNECRSITYGHEIDQTFRDDFGQSILHNCLMFDMVEIQFIIRTKLDIKYNQKESTLPNENIHKILSMVCDQGTGLQHIASQRDQLEVLEDLHNSLIDMNLKNNMNLDPFYYAAQNDSIKSFLWLLNKGYSIQYEFGKNTPLHQAVFQGSYAICKFICERKLIPINALDNHGYTPIQISVLRRQIECFKILMIQGGDLNQHIYQGWNVYTHIINKQQEFLTLVERNSCNQQLSMKFTLNDTNNNLLSRLFLFLFTISNAKMQLSDMLSLILIDKSSFDIKFLSILIYVQSLMSFFTILFLLLIQAQSSKQKKHDDNYLLELQKKQSSSCVCSKCTIAIYPKLSRHCIQCDTCTLVQEHHCPWLNTCIGWNNQKVFCCFLICLMAAMILMVGCKVIIMLLFVAHFPNSISMDFQILFGLFCNLLEVIFLMLLFISVMQILSDTLQNISKIEMELQGETSFEQSQIDDFSDRKNDDIKKKKKGEYTHLIIVNQQGLDYGIK